MSKLLLLFGVPSSLTTMAIVGRAVSYHCPFLFNGGCNVNRFWFRIITILGKTKSSRDVQCKGY